MTKVFEKSSIGALIILMRGGCELNGKDQIMNSE